MSTESWSAKSMLKAVCVILAIACCTPARAHEAWADGGAIPAWVKAQCCGPSEAHRLDPSQVSEDNSGYVVAVDGMTLHVPRSSALPSQDAHYWIFFNPALKPNPTVHCFFVLMGS